nr:hypothetical protein [Tanacetum cinerariifolium]
MASGKVSTVGRLMISRDKGLMSFKAKSSPTVKSHPHEDLHCLSYASGSRILRGCSCLRGGTIHETHDHHFFLQALKMAIGKSPFELRYVLAAAKRQDLHTPAKLG